MLTGLVVKADGTSESFEGDISDETVSDAVGSENVKRLALGQDYVAFIDDSGSSDENTNNLSASFVLNILGYVPDENEEPYVKNNVLFIGGKRNDDNYSLTESQVKVIRVLSHN